MRAAILLTYLLTCLLTYLLTYLLTARPAACHAVHTAELTHPRAAQALGQLVDSLSPDEVAALRDRLDHVERRTGAPTVRAAHAAP